MDALMLGVFFHSRSDIRTMQQPLLNVRLALVSWMVRLALASLVFIGVFSVGSSAATSGIIYGCGHRVVPVVRSMSRLVLIYGMYFEGHVWNK